jgi:hypothetical protein
MCWQTVSRPVPAIDRPARGSYSFLCGHISHVDVSSNYISTLETLQKPTNTPSSLDLIQTF